LKGMFSRLDLVMAVSGKNGKMEEMREWRNEKMMSRFGHGGIFAGLLLLERMVFNCFFFFFDFNLRTCFSLAGPKEILQKKEKKRNRYVLFVSCELFSISFCKLLKNLSRWFCLIWIAYW
jgi:hypothetical protein